MVFASTITDREIIGTRWKAWGTFTNGSGDTGGEVVTGLSVVETFIIQYTGSAVVLNAPVVYESFPLAGGSVTIVTDDDADGIWVATGLM